MKKALKNTKNVKVDGIVKTKTSRKGTFKAIVGTSLFWALAAAMFILVQQTREAAYTKGLNDGMQQATELLNAVPKTPVAK